MPFPETRVTLIHRLVGGHAENDWHQFMSDYWRPIRRFAMRIGKLQASDADDVASVTFQIIFRNQLLLRWTEDRSAKLRTLLCSVVRRELANRRRKKGNQQVQWDGQGPSPDLEGPLKFEVPADERDVFESLWLDEVLVRSLGSMRNRCLREGKIHLFRVLFGRVCEEMSHAEVADCLGEELTTVQGWFKQARSLLAESLRTQVRDIVGQYSTPGQLDQEFQREWDELADHLNRNGGLEAAIRQSHSQLEQGSDGSCRVKSEVLSGIYGAKTSPPEKGANAL